MKGEMINNCELIDLLPYFSYSFCSLCTELR